MTDTTHINRPVVVFASKGVVIAQEAGKRGSTTLTVRMKDGSTLKTDMRQVEFIDEPMLGGDGVLNLRGLRDHYGDARRMSARW